MVCSIGVYLIISFFWEDMHLYTTPSQLVEMQPHMVQLGGIVKDGSMQRSEKGISFVVSDDETNILVGYRGKLPAMVREGHSVLIKGQWNGRSLRAQTVYAKHDEYYRDQ
jgi:cytochrome c-type biogenesis protein CcmE